MASVETELSARRTYNAWVSAGDVNSVCPIYLELVPGGEEKGSRVADAACRREVSPTSTWLR